MLYRMRRNHTRESYLELVSHMRTKIPGVALSTDLMWHTEVKQKKGSPNYFRLRDGFKELKANAREYEKM